MYTYVNTHKKNNKCTQTILIPHIVTSPPLTFPPLPFPSPPFNQKTDL